MARIAAKRTAFSLLLPVLPLALWYAYHYARTGYVFGNPEFFRYNVAATLNPCAIPARACPAPVAGFRLYASVAADARDVAGDAAAAGER